VLGLRGRRALLAGQSHRSGHLLLVGVVLISVATVVWWPKAPQAAPLLPPPPTTAAVNEDEAVNIWIHGGGEDRVMAVVTANNDAFKTADHHRIASACENLLASVRTAEDFPKPPEERVRASWTTALASLDIGAVECVRVYRDNQGDPKLMVAKLTGALAPLRQTLTLLTEAHDRATR
jgi:hypothetical protein